MAVNQSYGTQEVQRDLIASIRQVYKEQHPDGHFDPKVSIHAIGLDSMSSMEVCGILEGKIQDAGLSVNPDTVDDWFQDSFASGDTTILSGARYFADGISKALKPLPQTSDDETGKEETA